MGFFASSLFWFIEGVLFVVAFVGVRYWFEDRGKALSLVKWLLLAAWLSFFLVTIGFVFVSIGEFEYGAAMKGAVIFGVVLLISGAGLWRYLNKTPAS